MIYNLLYHLTSVDKEMLWWNLKQLKPHLDIFNGRKIITVAKIDNNDIVVSKIKEFISDPEIEYIEVSNYPDRETSPFLFHSGPMLQSINENEFTFYAHSKGVGRNAVMKSVVLWTSFMYEWNLAKFELVQSALEDHDACGIFKCIVKWRNSDCSWHYPGTFWWFRHQQMFCSGSDINGNAISWDAKMPHPYHACGMEIWPGIQQPQHSKAANLLELPSLFLDNGFANHLFKDNRWIEYLGGKDQFEEEFNKRFNI